MDSPIDPQLPAVEQTDVNEPLVQLSESVEPAQSKRGRSASDISAFFTAAADPQTRKSAKCRHCNQVVNHHKKGESAMRHLNKYCLPFKKLMSGKDISDRPEWYVGYKKARLSSSSLQQVTSTSDKRQASISTFMFPKVDKATKERFQKHFAMHYYVTGTSFQRIEDPNLREAIKVLRPEACYSTAKNYAAHC
jgi:preprotein translocase subunit SecD